MAVLDAYDEWCRMDKMRDNIDTFAAVKIMHKLATELRALLAERDASSNTPPRNVNFCHDPSCEEPDCEKRSHWPDNSHLQQKETT